MLKFVYRRFPDGGCFKVEYQLICGGRMSDEVQAPLKHIHYAREL